MHMLIPAGKKRIVIIVILCIIVISTVVIATIVRSNFNASTEKKSGDLAGMSPQEIPVLPEWSYWNYEEDKAGGPKPEYADENLTMLPASPSNKPSSKPSAAPPKNTTPPSPQAINRLGLFPKATVLVLPGADLHTRDDTPDALSGVFNRTPYVAKEIDYPRNLTLDSIPTGVSNIDKAIRSTQGPIIVMAYSQGAQVASEWMRGHASDSSVPGADRLMFVLFGNPLRASGGAKINNPTKRTTGLATPTDTRWHIVDIARRYDGFADSPNDKNNEYAVKNAERGKFLVHPRYEYVDIFAKSNTVWNRGNTTFILTYENALPIFGDNEVSDSEIKTMRERIESAYNRL